MSTRPTRDAPQRSHAFGLLDIFFSTSVPRQAAVVGCLLLASLADGLGLATLLPAIELASGQAGTDGPAQRAAAAALGAVGLPATLGVLLAVVAAALVLKSALTLIAVNYAGYAGAQVGTDLRLRLLDALLNVRWNYFTRQPVGRFVNAMNSEAQRASTAYMDVANLITNVIQSAVLLAVALLVSWQLSLVGLALGALVVLILGRLVRLARRAGRQQTERTRRLAARLTDTLVNIKPLKAMARHVRAGDLFAADVRELNRNQRRQILARQANRLLQEPVVGIFLIAAFYMANRLLGMPLQEVLVMGLVLLRMLGSVGKAQQSYQAATMSESAYWSIRDTIVEAEAEREVWGGQQVPTLAEGITFRDVTMAYGSTVVLEAFSLAVPAGGIVALLGPSGAGKTTVVDLLLGLYRAQAGRIEIDGVPIEAIDVSRWRRQVGYVPQEVILFNDSVLMNVTLGAPDFTPADAQRALEAAGAWDFVSRLPEGLNSPVGERGALLSGGQRQRIAIARALVHRPSLLILDEATSALDPVTEAAICRNVKEISRMTGLTVLAISHQPAWAEVADRVYRIEPAGARSDTRAAGTG